MSKTIIYLLSVIFLCLISCKNAEQNKENLQLSDTIEQKLNESDFKVLELSRMTKRDWDKVCIISPYSMNSHVEKEIGFAWDVESNTDIVGNDGLVLLLFIKNNQVVEFTQHPRNKGDFLNADLKSCLSKNDALFTLETRQGWRYFISTNQNR